MNVSNLSMPWVFCYDDLTTSPSDAAAALRCAFICEYFCTSCSLNTSVRTWRERHSDYGGGIDQRISLDRSWRTTTLFPPTHRMRGDAHKVCPGSLVPPQDPFCLVRLVQAVYRALVEQATNLAVWSECSGGLDVHPRERRVFWVNCSEGVPEHRSSSQFLNSPGQRVLVRVCVMWK